MPRRRPSRRLVLGAAIPVAALVAVPMALGQTVPRSLMGENLFSGNITITNQDCAAAGSGSPSSFSFSASGVATGPYVGSFTESGTVEIGPESTTPPAPGVPPGTFGLVTGFTAQFTITAADATITGTKTFAPSIHEAAFGQCISGTDAQAITEAFCEARYGDAGVQGSSDVFNATAVYTATITSGGQEFSDSGDTTAFGSLQNFECANNSDNGEGAFSERFPVSNGVEPVNTAGQVEGGGQISHVQGTSSADAVTFGLTVQSDGTDFKGNCNVYDHDMDRHFFCDTVTSYQQIANQATFAGTGHFDDGTTTDYRITVQDNHDSGMGSDTFSITTGQGYNASGVLTEGNVQVHDNKAPAL